MKQYMLKRFFLLLALLLPLPVLAQSTATLPNTRVELLSETASPRPGQPFTVGIRMTPNKGWHVYWSHPGDSGMPTRAAWSAPATELRYPVPETYMVAGLMNHVYSHAATLLADITLPADASGKVPLSVKLDWLVCDDSICVPESASLTLPLIAGDGAADPAQAAHFAAARAAMPRALNEAATFASNNGRIRISIPLAGSADVTAAHFFAQSDDALLFAAPQTIRRTNTQLLVETDAVPGTNPANVPGLIRLDRAGGHVEGFTLIASPGPVPTGGVPLADAASTSAMAGAASLSTMAGFLPAFGLAILGGLLLNLMPCVFPILSLKALAIARAGHSEAAARMEALAYTAGVILITSALGLAAILIARAGAGAGWAFQLQDARVILILMLLMIAIAFNFAGLFEVNLGTANVGAKLTEKPGARGAFFTGALAAFVATPCTGPFMAGALGAALILPPAAGLAVFAGLGLGLALPFLALGFIPALRRRLPRPGPWMLSFRRILAIPMFLTALALAWVLGRQSGMEGLMLGLLVALVVACGLWWLGLRQQGGRAVALPIALALLAALVGAATLARLPEPGATRASTAFPTTPFTAEALARSLAEKRPTFLYFTADWCLTCKVNEQGALASPDVAGAFKAANIHVIVADWTRPDPAIAKFLAERQRAGIPLYLFYAPDGTVTELPQLLSVDMLTALASKG